VCPRLLSRPPRHLRWSISLTSRGTWLFPSSSRLLGAVYAKSEHKLMSMQVNPSLTKCFECAFFEVCAVHGSHEYSGISGLLLLAETCPNRKRNAPPHSCAPLAATLAWATPTPTYSKARSFSESNLCCLWPGCALFLPFWEDGDTAARSLSPQQRSP